MRYMRNYWAVLKAIFPFILLSVLIQHFFTAGMRLFGMELLAQQWVQVFLLLVILLLQVYLWSAALWCAHTIFLGRPVRLNEACRVIYQKLSTIGFGFFIMLFLFCTLFFIGHLLVNIIVHFAINKALARNISLILLIGLPLTFFLMAFFFVIPLLVLKSMPIQQAFQDSFRLMASKNWPKIVIIYAASIVLLFLISANTLHGQWLARHYLSVVFDVAVLTIAAPVLLNAILSVFRC